MNIIRVWKPFDRLILAVGVSVCFIQSGCVLSGQSAYIDSMSRMPWFNLEFKERKRSADNPFRSVSWDRESDGTFRAEDAHGSIRTAGLSSPALSLPVSSAVRPIDSSQTIDFH